MRAGPLGNLVSDESIFMGTPERIWDVVLFARSAEEGNCSVLCPIGNLFAEFVILPSGNATWNHNNEKATLLYDALWKEDMDVTFVFSAAAVMHCAAYGLLPKSVMSGLLRTMHCAKWQAATSPASPCTEFDRVANPFEFMRERARAPVTLSPDQAYEEQRKAHDPRKQSKWWAQRVKVSLEEVCKQGLADALGREAIINAMRPDPIELETRLHVDRIAPTSNRDTDDEDVVLQTVSYTHLTLPTKRIV